MAATPIVRKIKIRNSSGNSGTEYQIGVEAKNVIYNSKKTAQDVLQLLLDRSNLASEFAQNKTYNPGDYVFYNNKLFKFTGTHTYNADWSTSIVQQVNLADQVKSIMADLPGKVDFSTLAKRAGIANVFDQNTSYVKGEYVYHEDTSGNYVLYRFDKDQAQGTAWTRNNVKIAVLGDQIKADHQAIYKDVNTIVQVSRTTPTGKLNKLWINNYNPENEVSVPTYDDFINLKSELKSISLDVDNHELVITTVN